MSLHIVILAAGQGKRMHSNQPKVLHQLAGKAILARVIETAQGLNPAAIHVIIGHGGEQIKQELGQFSVNWVLQQEQLGTGHALLQALPNIPESSQVLVLSGDVPLIQVNTLKALITEDKPSPVLRLLVASPEDPTGLGRIHRNAEGQICAIIEEKDASEQQRQIKEIYSGICCVKASALGRWLPALQCHNAQGEYYLTDIIAMAVSEGLPITALSVHDYMEILGVNNRLQLQQLERALQMRITTQLMLSGTTLADAARVDVRGELSCGRDVFIDVNTVFVGAVVIGNGSTIGANCRLTNVIIGDNSEILPNSVLDGCHIGDNCHIGPFARLRPGTQLSSHCKIGNFVETKNAVFDNGTKASHLSYLGDVVVGKNVNIGAGTITCNYDGSNKYQTIIEDGAFIGSDTQLVAPVNIGKDATIGAGSTIRRNAPAGELTLTETKQVTIHGWRRPQKKLKD